MKNFLIKLSILLIIFIGVKSVTASTISGTVYDSRRNSLINVNVELMDSYHSLMKVTTTDGIGRYSFDGLNDGYFYVRVLPFRYDFDEETQMVEIKTISLTSRQGYTNQIMDFVLTPRKGTLAEAQAEIVFAQEIPDTAKKSFDAGQKLLRKGKIEEAINSFQEAVKTFPDYYLANHYLGAVYYNNKDFEHAVPPLLKAVQINDKNGVTLFFLGYSLAKLNYNKAAIIALSKASIIIPSSPAVFAALGVAQRMERVYKDAEKSLLQAKKLQKSENAEIYKELGALYSETAQYDKAIDSLEHMLKVGTFSDADTEKIKEQIKKWKELTAQKSGK